MKRTICLLCALGLLLLAACGDKKEVTVDYGSSERYTKEDMDAAMEAIRAEFDTWKGCELHALCYGGDAQCTEENLRWLNELGQAQQGEGGFTECMEFLSDFHSPKRDSGAWNADFEYTDWQWWLARRPGGEWVLLTWGY